MCFCLLKPILSIHGGNNFVVLLFDNKSQDVPALVRIVNYEYFHVFMLKMLITHPPPMTLVKCCIFSLFAQVTLFSLSA